MPGKIQGPDFELERPVGHKLLVMRAPVPGYPGAKIP